MQSTKLVCIATTLPVGSMTTKHHDCCWSDFIACAAQRLTGFLNPAKIKDGRVLYLFQANGKYLSHSTSLYLRFITTIKQIQQNPLQKLLHIDVISTGFSKHASL